MSLHTSLRWQVYASNGQGWTYERDTYWLWCDKEKYSTFKSASSEWCQCSIGDETFDCTQQEEKLNAYCETKYVGLYSSYSIDNWGTCMCTVGTNQKECSTVTATDLEQLCSDKLPKYSQRNSKEWKCDCPNWVTDDGRNECIVNNEGLLGIDCNGEKLMNNTCSRNINKTLGIRTSDPNPNPTWLLQDVTLAATSFIGTLLMVALLYLWVKAVLAGWGDSDELSDIKTKMKNLAIWFLLVIASYTIIRLIQYIAKGV